MITIKIGGSVFDELHETIICDIRDVIRNNNIVFVHGGAIDCVEFHDPIRQYREIESTNIWCYLNK